MLRVIALSLIFLPLNIVADAFLSSPKLSLNTQGERVIEFKIQSSRISDKDIILIPKSAKIFTHSCTISTFHSSP